MHKEEMVLIKNNMGLYQLYSGNFIFAMPEGSDVYKDLNKSKVYCAPFD